MKQTKFEYAPIRQGWKRVSTWDKLCHRVDSDPLLSGLVVFGLTCVSVVVLVYVVVMMLKAWL